MTFPNKKAAFDKNNPVTESCLLTFNGVDGFDVYNCSIPFFYNGKRYMYGRIEHRDDWARSWVRLFLETSPDEYTLVNNSMIYPLEDPYVSRIGDEIILGGTHVQYQQGEYKDFFSYFYKGNDLDNLYYFTTGPVNMKDIRLVQLKNKIGVFSRPRGEEILREHGSESIIGYTEISDIKELSADVIKNARKIENIFDNDEWGGCNQCYNLDSGLIGVIGHKSYKEDRPDVSDVLVYVNISFVFNPKTHEVLDEKIIATRSSYPAGPAKKTCLIDCAFASGIVMRDDGMADLYSGLGDTMQGRAVIEYPFEGFGRITSPL
ncbi:MAG: DUF1861 family protein [Oscillospiraceae bacterium]|nr:DUF1861 family protein [Oscillospiraceae bacterium]